MKFIPRFTGTVFGGEFIPKDEDSYRLYLRTLEDREVEATICEPHKNRTIPQNNYFHAYVRLICDETGDLDVEGMKEWLKDEKGEKIEVEAYGKRKTVSKSTALYTKNEMTEFIRKIEVLTGIPAPDTEKVSIQ